MKDTREREKGKEKGEKGEGEVLSFILYPLSFPLRLSQGNLNLLATCPRKFQHTYLEQLAAPNPPEQQEKQNQGNRFHLLMQQWQLGLPIAPFIQADGQLQQWFKAFTNAAPKILTLGSGEEVVLSQSEHTRTLEFQGYLFTVVYDLLLSGQQSAKILDWKTYPRPQNSRWLLENWQTRLYPFVLAETSTYLPEQISMTYWFFQATGEQATAAAAQSFAIAYNAAKHEQTRQDLSQLLTQLTHWLDQYQAGEPFPHLAFGSKPCETCTFPRRCFGPEVRQDDLAALPDRPGSLPSFEEIEEVPL
ncbi:PD-(D/E)XK nuclease family protein [Kovacikia minuta CCNUW1]|uniref:PD-(D/E)XK nuclease family protein n=1 Tax=Kovacikia minuta TaxID=2931930 RepID=UPI001CCBF121|nr:PD-(D/E)XK nuclease family protein [Kovacikia minuta]UBF25357.1 PD-(D/E)XK nuclease family protein [Kovacikia minuta CCNUW1]